MKHLFCLFFTVVVFSSQANASIDVFACEPEWASLVKEVGGKDVSVYVATTARQDPHHIEARPSLLARVGKADFVVCTGAELEIGWLPLLLRKAGKSSVQKGQQGYFMAADQIKRKLEVPKKLDRSMGDVHAAGNPHVHLNPYHILTVAQQLENRLAKVDAANAKAYRQRGADFRQRWKKSLASWEAKIKPLKGKKTMVYHKSFSYFLDWAGIKEVADLEPKPGIPPSAGHLSSLLSVQATEKASWLLYAPYQSEKAVRWLQNKTKISSLKLPYTVGGSKSAKDLFSLYEEQINLLLKAG